jgi:hypothetical protein
MVMSINLGVVIMASGVDDLAPYELTCLIDLIGTLDLRRPRSRTRSNGCTCPFADLCGGRTASPLLN